MIKVAVTQATHPETGILTYHVFCQGVTQIKPTADRQFALEYAKAIHFNYRGNSQLILQDLDHGKERVLDTKSN